MAYTIYGLWVAGYLQDRFSGRFIPALLLSISYYLNWFRMLGLIFSTGILLASLLGLFFFENKKRQFMLGLWLAYLVFGLYFNYHISTHDYYSLPLIPIVALSLAPLADLIFSKLALNTSPRILRPAVYSILLFGIFLSMTDVRDQLKSVDYRPEAAYWVEVGQKINGKTAVGLTQDYGVRLAYWDWQRITAWPSFGDLLYHDDLKGAQFDFEKQFENMAFKKALFVVTDFSDLARQPLLQAKLSTYPIFSQGNGYIIYDLKSGPK